LEITKLRTHRSWLKSLSHPTPRFAAAVLAAALLLTGSPSVGRAASGLTVRLLVAQGALGDWSAFAAQEQGYFQDEGVEVQINSFSRQSDIATAIISGRGDVGFGSLPTVLTGALTGAPLEMISATQMATPNGGYDNWWATLPGSPINKPADLRGKKVDIYSQNSLAQAVTREILANAGIKADEYQEVVVPFPQSYTALEGGLLDVALFIEPFYTASNQLSKQKYGKPLKLIYTYLTDFKNGLDLTAMFANTDFVTKNPDAVRAFLRATTRAAKWGNTHPVELKKIIAKYAGVPYDDIKDMIPSEMSEDGKPIPGMFDQVQTLMIKYKMVPGYTSPLKPETYMDLSYLPVPK
jgi:NitT/TauT family transport system substrate-binding protein